jgi:hypothetical protein
MLELIAAFTGKKTNLTAGTGSSAALYGVLSGEIPVTMGIGVVLLCALAATLRAAIKKVEEKIDAMTGEKK